MKKTYKTIDENEFIKNFKSVELNKFRGNIFKKK